MPDYWVGSKNDGNSGKQYFYREVKPGEKLTATEEMRLAKVEALTGEEAVAKFIRWTRPVQ